MDVFYSHLFRGLRDSLDAAANGQWDKAIALAENTRQLTDKIPNRFELTASQILKVADCWRLVREMMLVVKDAEDVQPLVERRKEHEPTTTPSAYARMSWEWGKGYEPTITAGAQLDGDHKLVPSKPNVGKRWTLYRAGQRRPIAYVDDIEDARKLIGDRHHG